MKGKEMKTTWIFKGDYSLGGHIWIGINSPADPHNPDAIFRFQIKTPSGRGGDCNLSLNDMDLCAGLNFVKPHPMPKSRHKDTKIARKKQSTAAAQNSMN
jgi:hypothetical protein